MEGLALIGTIAVYSYTVKANLSITVISYFLLLQTITVVIFANLWYVKNTAFDQEFECIIISQRLLLFLPKYFLLRISGEVL